MENDNITMVLELLNGRLNRLEEKLDSALTFKWVITGGLMAITTGALAFVCKIVAAAIAQH